jgi:hypothetical protein
MISVAIAKIMWRCPVCLFEREANDFETITPRCPHGCEDATVYYSRDHVVPVVGHPVVVESEGGEKKATLVHHDMDPTLPSKHDRNRDGLD